MRASVITDQVDQVTVAFVHYTADMRLVEFRVGIAKCQVWGFLVT